MIRKRRILKISLTHQKDVMYCQMKMFQEPKVYAASARRDTSRLITDKCSVTLHASLQADTHLQDVESIKEESIHASSDPRVGSLYKGKARLK